MLNSTLLIAAYAFIGSGMKYVDQVFDEGIFNKKFALVLTVVGSVLSAYLILTDPYSATLILSLIIGMSLVRKVDNPAFYLAASLIIAIPTITLFVYTNGFADGQVPIKWGPLGLLALSAVSDELMHDRAEAKIRRRKKLGPLDYVMYYRPVMKFSMVSLVYFLVFPFIYLIAFLAFDLCYTIVEKISLSGREGRNVKWLEKNYYNGHKGSG